MSWRALVFVVALAIAAAACSSSGDDGLSAVGADESTAEANDPAAVDPTPTPSRTIGDEPAEEPMPGEEPTPPAQFGCGTATPSADLVAAAPATIEETRAQLALMHELYQDTVLLRDELGVRVNHMMVDGLPSILVRTDDAAGRCEQILETVTRPDLVRFVQWTEEDYSRALDLGLPPWRRLIEADVGYNPGGSEDPLWISIGTGRYGVTSVTLRADQEELAATLLERYAELIELSVGNFAYPPERIDPETPDACGTLPSGSSPVDIKIREATLLGDVLTGQIEVVVSNDGTNTVHLVPSRIAELTTPGSAEQVTSFTGAMTMENRGSIRLDPGAEITVRATPSTASCKLDIGYSLPAGAYDLVLPIQVFDAEASENDVSERVLLPRVEIELG